MQRHRFYAQPESFTDRAVTLDQDESHHIARVLRLGEGDQVYVFDGNGTEYRCEIARVGKHEVELALIERLESAVESPLDLILAQALIKGDKFDWVVQKSTELGVSQVVPIITEFGGLKRPENHAEERMETRLQRWRRISLEAVKQCGRRKLVEIAGPVGFAEFCESREGKGRNLIFSERGGKTMDEIKEEIGDCEQISLSIGGEGGWSDKELQTAADHKFTPVYFGGRILRTETAAIAAVTLTQFLFGDTKRKLRVDKS